MKADPCNVCGGSEVNLVDGYYYCVECGTQDVNVRETVVEQKSLADGTFAASTRKKIVTTAAKGIEMSSEWYRWHAFNFVLEGLAEELVNLGADPSFKIKLLWIWTRYVRMYQNKEQLGLIKDKDKSVTLESLIELENTTHQSEENSSVRGKTKPKQRSQTFHRDINFLSKGVIVSMLHLALNLDRSPLQISHLFRFLKEGRISLKNINKYIPKEINLKVIQQWTGFIQGIMCGAHTIRAISMTLIKKLDLGVPIVPDMKKILNDFMQELCLPKHMKNLVLSLMQFIPLDYVDVTSRNIVGTVRVPDYEATVMSYVLVALKMCFGLDDDYEIKLSDAVENINAENGFEKSYRIGVPEETERLFSFRQWSNYLRARKIMLGKQCLYMAEQNCLDLDDHVFMEHMVARTRGKVELMDEIAMDLLEKIPLEPVRVIPKQEFTPTTTPISTYTQVILDHCQDPELKLLLSEDFSQYSLKYACEDLRLIDSDTSKNIVEGVSELYKVQNDVIDGVLETKKSDVTMVYVKNCENKNWLKTNPPSMEHVDKVTAEKEKATDNDKDTDHGYASNAENSSDSRDKTEEPEKIEMIKEEDENKNIFDDTFEGLEQPTEEKSTAEDPCMDNLIYEDRISYSLHANDDDLIQSSDEENVNDWDGSVQFDPNTFDRERTKKELILTACKKYRIPIPKEYKPKGPVKRRVTNNEAGPNSAKRRRVCKPNEAKKEVDKLITAYNEHMERDILKQVSEQVRTAIQHWDNSLGNNENNVIPRDDTILDNNLTVDETNQNDISEISRIDGTVNNIDLDQDNFDKSELADNLESTLFEDETDEENDALETKGDPKFDENKYDIDQLYIKVEEEEYEDYFELKDDPIIEEIFSRKFKEAKKTKGFSKLRRKVREVADASDSDDELPLNVLQQEKLYVEQRFKETEMLNPLAKDFEGKFRYWLRHYTSELVRKSLDMHEKFELELEKNCPKSFYFVIRECASVLNCSTFYLYKSMQRLEQCLVARAKLDDNF